MSASPTQKRESPSSSPAQSPTQFASMTSVLEIVVHSVMEGVKDAKIIVPVDATVFELKRTISIATDVSPEQQILLFKDRELKDNTATLDQYGIVSACTLTMNVKMHTGILVDHAAVEHMTFLPLLFPHNNVGRLRNTIREMTNVKEFTRRSKDKNNSPNLPTPAKQKEHEKTRKRMKALIQKRKQPTQPTVLPPPSPLPSSGSVLSRSPLTEPTSPFDRSEKTAVSSRSSTVIFKNDKPSNLHMTEKELKLFFEPPESVDELLRNQQEFCVAPETVEELEKRKKDLENLEKTICKLCRRKLKLSEQEIRCMCNFAFCNRHREPSVHFCQIDYKGAGRTKILKENPKVVFRDVHKAQAGN